MKMSDVFKLPLSEEQVCNRLGCAWAIDKDKVEAVASAINNHDRLEQEVAELKSDLEFMADMSRYDAFSRGQYERIEAIRAKYIKNY